MLVALILGTTLPALADGGAGGLSNGGGTGGSGGGRLGR